MEMRWQEPRQAKWKVLEDILLEGLFINGVLTRRVKDTINEQTFGMRSQTRVGGSGLIGILNATRIPFIPFPYRPIPILASQTLHPPIPVHHHVLQQTHSAPRRNVQVLVMTQLEI